MLAASGVSTAADAEVREQVSQGNFGEAAKLASYHMPFVGPGRRMWEAAKQGDSLGMLFNSGMLLAEGAGMKFGMKAGKGGKWLGGKGEPAKMGAGLTEAKLPIKVGDYTFSNTAAKHFNEIIKKSGWYNRKASRSYMRSPLTIQEIISSGKGVPDQFLKGATKYHVPGECYGRRGIWELIIHHKEKKIYHFLFNPDKK